MKTKRPENIKKTFKRLLAYVYQFKFRLVFVFICMILSSVCTVRGTYYLKPAINDFLIPLIGKKNPDFSVFIIVLGKMSGLYLLAVFCSFIQTRIMAYVSNQIMFTVRNDMFAKMQDLPISYFGNNSNGKIMSYYTNDVDAMSNMLRQSFPKITDGIVTCVFIFVTIFVVNWKLALIVVGCQTMSVLVLKVIVKRNVKYFSNQQHGLSQINGFAEEMINGCTEIKAFCKEDDVIDKFEKINNDLCKVSAKAGFYADSIFCITNGLSNIGFTVIAVSGGLMAVYGMSDIGTVGTFLQYYKSMYNPLTNISKQFNNLLNALAGAERIFDFLDTEPEIDNGNVEFVNVIKEKGKLKESSAPTGLFAWKKIEQSGEVVYKPFAGEMNFEHVYFGYSANQPVLKDFNLLIKPKQKVAFVGSTGAGKTTVTNILNRFYEIQSGRILCDGIDIKTIKKESLRSMMVMVLQDTHLFTGSIADNIRYGYLDAEQKDIEFAARLANADLFIQKCKDGYDTMLIHDGNSLSQGQRQLLAISRVAVSNAPVLILDEATSSIDTRTEKLIEEGFDSIMSGRTVLVIAHRLSTVKNSDIIVVLDNGEIVEKGTHSELIRQQGLYYRLCSGLTELN